jgi:hypothetical protein
MLHDIYIADTKNKYNYSRHQFCGCCLCGFHAVGSMEEAEREVRAHFARQVGFEWPGKVSVYDGFLPGGKLIPEPKPESTQESAGPPSEDVIASSKSVSGSDSEASRERRSRRS